VTNEGCFSFRCNACGRCCNSPPVMTVDELFRHEQRFIGCLTVSFIHPPAAGAKLHGQALTAAEAAQWRQAVMALSFPLDGRPGSPRLRLGTQAHDYPSLGACPARLSDGRCEIHDDGQPVACAAVPLNAALPDGLQRVVLHQRSKEAAWMGADCIVEGRREGWPVLVEGERIVDEGYRRDLHAHRAALQAQVPSWAAPVAALLGHELRLGGTALQMGVPACLTLPLVPVLAVLAEASAPARERARCYAQAQAGLIERKVAAALQRKNPLDRAMTQELRRFKGHYERFAQA
jgi:Fe-S-cluster containining protein